MTVALAQILGEPVGEADEDDDQSLSQRVNDVLATYAADLDASMQPHSTPSPAQPPITTRLNPTEREELEQFRALFGRLHLQPSSLGDTFDTTPATVCLGMNAPHVAPAPSPV